MFLEKSMCKSEAVFPDSYTPLAENKSNSFYPIQVRKSSPK